MIDTVKNSSANGALSAEARWAGGRPPLDIGWRKLMMWIFIVTEGLLFAGVMASYGIARLAAASWPSQLEVFHLWFLSLMTFVLISTSGTMAAAVACARSGDMPRAKRFIQMTLAGGLVFIGMQAWEWTTIIREGASMASNPWGVSAFGHYFFLITGLHGSHVLVGLILLALVGLRASDTPRGAELVEVTGLYWHFVDLIWVFVFTLFYLI